MAAAATTATITITDCSPNPDNYLYKVNFNSHTITTTVTSDPSLASAWISAFQTTAHHYHNIVGLDVEWRPNFNRNVDNPIATLQLCVGPSCLIYQLLYSPPPLPRTLSNFLSNKNYTFVGVGIGSDVERLIVDHDLTVGKTADLGDLAAEKAGLRRNSGLKELARVLLGVEVEKPKSITLSRWDSEWLSYQQIQYACVDAFLSFEIGTRLLSVPSSTVMSSTLPAIEPLNGTNHKKWKRDVRSALQFLDIDLAIEEPCPSKPSTDSFASDVAKYEKWQKSNKMCLGYLKSLVSEEYKEGLFSFETAKEFLTVVDNIFVESDKAKTSEIITKITSMRYNPEKDKDVRQFLMRMANLNEKLKHLKMDLAEPILIHLASNALPSSFNPMSAAYDITKEKLNFNEFVSICAQYEKRDKVQNSQTTMLAHGKPLQSNTPGTSSSGGEKGKEFVNKGQIEDQQGASRDLKVRKCFFCDKKGHLKKNCHKYKAWLEKKESEGHKNAK